jgi:phospholipase C
VKEILDPYEAERLEHDAPDEYLRRREFLERMTATVGASLGIAAGLGIEPLMAEAARRESRAGLPSPRNLPIDTFVVVMMENRSFDHLLGWMPKADGRQAGLSYTDSTGQRFPTHPLAPDFRGCGHSIPGHIWEQARVQFNRGACDGFLLNGSGNDVYAIGYYGEHDLPYLPHLAKAFTTYDRYFPSLLSSTNPNRSYMHAAQSYGEKHIFLMPGDGEPQFPTPPGFPAGTTIEARLARKGLQGMTFYSDLNYTSLWGSRGIRHSAPIAEYFERAATGKLPALSFVDPQLMSFKELAGVSTDEHPLSDIRTGEAFVADAVRAFIHSPHWRRGALFVVYDEWGGFFDHVRPPSVPDARQSSNLDEDFGQMGFRVPAVAVSPHVRRGHINHTRFGHESILRMVEYRYGLRPLTIRDARTNNIATSFDWHTKPHFTPPRLPRPPQVVSEPCA